MTIPPGVFHIIEPFVGNGDLLGFINDKNNYTIETYDIDPKYENSVRRDTLQYPPDYTNKFVLTNPPYLARNKSDNKELYDKYECNDLYKCFLVNLIECGVCQGGIIIIPLNFISSIRKSDINLRMRFLDKYTIHTLNIFEERVFDDTSYAVCSLYFLRKTTENTPIQIQIYPSRKEMSVELTPENNFTIGGEIYNLAINAEYKVQRATRISKTNITNILLKCIDDNIDSQLGFKMVEDTEVEKYIDNTPNLSARSYMRCFV